MEKSSEPSVLGEAKASLGTKGLELESQSTWRFVELFCGPGMVPDCMSTSEQGGCGSDHNGSGHGHGH